MKSIVGFLELSYRGENPNATISHAEVRCQKTEVLSQNHNVDKRQTLAYLLCMKYLNWEKDKNELLKKERGISFEEIAFLIESGNIITIEENPNRPNQKIYVIEIDNYIVIVPFVESENEIFLKTAFPSRKYTKIYGSKREK